MLSRAALLLRELSVVPEGLTPIALADRVGLPRSTCYRIVGTLCQEGFMRLAPSGKLHIGAGLISIAAAGRRELRHEAAPYLKKLSLELHETVELVVLDGDEALFTDQYVPQRSLRVVAEVGDRFPLYCSACGKAHPGGVARRRRRSGSSRTRIEALTSHTIVDREALLREIDAVRGTGVAYDHQEHTLGVSAVGAAVHDAGGAMAAITVAMPAARLEGQEERIAAELLRTRDEIQKAVATPGEARVPSNAPGVLTPASRRADSVSTIRHRLFRDADRSTYPIDEKRG